MFGAICMGDEIAYQGIVAVSKNHGFGVARLEYKKRGKVEWITPAA